MNNTLPIQLIQQQVQTALQEDLGAEQLDITALLIAQDTQVTANIICREHAVICGQAWCNETFEQLGDVAIKWQVNEGQSVLPNTVLATLTGSARQLLTGERTALNFLQTLSATATTSQQYAEKIADTDCRLLDTRKTLPGLRLAQKYAVTCGGGYNHRIGLFDAFLIKENHIAACGSIEQAISKARTLYPDRKCEIEVENEEQLRQALSAKPDIIMLDNFTLDAMQQAVEITAKQCLLEASGDISLDNIHAVALTGVDYISVGSLTKHIRAIDLSMLIIA